MNNNITTPDIKVTYDYDLFSFIESNRPVRNTYLILKTY
jgi:hypothetical protein